MGYDAGVLRLLIALVLMLSVAAGCEYDPAPPPAPTIHAPAGAFVHQGSGFEFPLDVGVLERTEIAQYDDAGQDVSVDYRGVASPIVATVYVYPAYESATAGQPPSEDHFDGVKASLTHENTRAEQIGGDEAVPIRQRSGVVGWHATYRFDEQIGSDRRGVRTEAYLFLHKTWYVKYRFTYPEELTTSIGYSLGEFMDELKWPD
jgi:hypothetical protein